MVKLVGLPWVAERLGSPEFVLVDPRRPMKHLSGHLPGAVNLPAYRAFGDDGQLLNAAVLTEWFGAGGIGDGLKPLLYDSPQGQNAAMLAWILQYLGVPEIFLMNVFYEQWKADGRDVTYRPVEPQPRHFTPHENPAIRATLDDVRSNTAEQLVDFRSREEFSGERDLDGHPGHIPHAVNLVWRDLNGPDNRLLAPHDQLERMITTTGIDRGQKVIAYCRSGSRAALGYLALSQLGYDVRLFDGSFAEWARAKLPVEK